MLHKVELMVLLFYDIINLEDNMKIIFDYEFDNWNKTIAKCRSNYYYANAQKKKEMEYVKWELIKQKIQPIKEYPIKIIFHFSTKTNTICYVMC